MGVQVEGFTDLLGMIALIWNKTGEERFLHLKNEANLEQKRDREEDMSAS